MTGLECLNALIYVRGLLTAESIVARKDVIRKNSNRHTALDHRTLCHAVRVERRRWQKYLIKLEDLARTPFLIAKRSA